MVINIFSKGQQINFIGESKNNSFNFSPFSDSLLLNIHIELNNFVKQNLVAIAGNRIVYRK